MNGSTPIFRYLSRLLFATVCFAFLQACAPTNLGTVGDAGSASMSAGGLDEYILQSGDKIYIQVFNDEELTMEATVGQSGTINYSYLGSIEVAGLSAEQLADSITEKLANGYLNDPSVNITVQQYRSFFMDGEVNRPGSYVFEPGLTLAKALTLAGGMTDRGSRRKMYLVREVDGEKKEYQINLSQRIQPGDVVRIEQGLF